MVPMERLLWSPGSTRLPVPKHQAPGSQAPRSPADSGPQGGTREHMPSGHGPERLGVREQQTAESMPAVGREV